MTVQAKVTLRYGLLVVFMVGAISAVNVAIETDQQFASMLERARAFDGVAVSAVTQTFKTAEPSSPLQEVLADPGLAYMFEQIMLRSRNTVLQIAVVDENNKILLDSIPEASETLPKYEDFEMLVNRTNWLQKLNILWKGARYYQVESKPQRTPTGQLLYVRAVIDPTFIRIDIKPHLEKDLTVAFVAVIGAVCLTFLFSAFAFRPLGRLRRQLDLVASGDYDPEVPTSASLSPSCPPRSTCWANGCVARNSKSPTCGEISSTCFRTWRTPFSSSTASYTLCSLPGRSKSSWDGRGRISPAIPLPRSFRLPTRSGCSLPMQRRTASPCATGASR